MNKFYFIAIFLFLFFNWSYGQTTFEDVEITNIASLSYWEPVDINGDGHKDILGMGFYDVDWLENTGVNGEFLRKKNITDEAQYLSSVVTLDYDNDGDLDVISASLSDDKIAWYENLDGMGNFGAQQFIATSITQVGKIYLYDIDQDGDQDILHHLSSASDLYWIENTGSATNNFANVNLYAENVIFDRLEDIDNDGDLDIIGSHDYIISWYENDGNNQFSGAQTILNSGFQIYNVDYKDFDSDGDLDVLIQKNSSPFRFTYILNEGSGNFGSEIEVFQVLEYFDSIQFDAEDVDGDNDIDFLLGLDGTIFWIENLGGYNFSGANALIDIPKMNKIVCEDIDGDGNVDLLVQSNFNVLNLLKGTGTSVDFSDISMLSANADEPVAIVAKDITGDGNDDIIFASQDDGRIGWYENIGGEEVFGPQNLIHFETGVPKELEVFDIDGDGDLDIVSIAVGTQYVGQEDNVKWFENDGNGNFSEPNFIDFDTFNHNNSLTVFDMDGDNDMDVIVVIGTSFDGNSLLFYENLDGQGNFGSSQILAHDIGDDSKVFNGDIDGDGDLDIYTTSRLSNSVSWFQNTDGMGNFGSRQIITDTALSTVGAIATDLDGDGDLDIAYMSNQNEDSIFWQENLDGLGNFGPRILITSLIEVNGSTFILSTDLDGDGDQDIVTSSRTATGSSNPDKVVWIENIDGQATFDPPKTISAGVSVPANGTFSDFDNDGDIDIYSTNTFAGSLFLHRNLSDVRNEISGYVRMSLSSSGCDDTNPTIPGVLVNTEGDSGSYATFTLDNEFSGFYQTFVGLGEYNTSIPTAYLPNYYTSNPESDMVNFNDFSELHTLDFCIEPIATINDLNIAVYPSLDDPRPGFDTNYQLVYSNSGTTQLSGSVTFEFDDSKLQFLNASETVSSQTSSVLTFDYVDLNPFETRTIDLEFNVFPPPTSNIGDVLVTTATVNPVSGDLTEEDNLMVLTQTLIGSYDPNDITCLEGEQILFEDADKYLHYLIRFQNTGTASAINVRVENVLDDKLDWTTMQLESLSHDGRVEIINGSEVSFVFDNINLPDSNTDEPNSHGYIAYKIKPKDDVVLGDIFYNTADIYFDFNPPIVTNTYETEIVEEQLSLSEFEDKLFRVFPNPTHSDLTIESTLLIEELDIVDINGRLLKNHSVQESGTFSINVSELDSGIYFLNIQAEGKQQTVKFIKN